MMRNDSILFSKGFGYSDIKNKIRTTPTTTFRIASVTKTFSGELIMQLVEQGKLDLNTPISKFGVDLGNKDITVKNLLTHTSEGDPGSYFQYNGYRYGKLTDVVESATGIPFYELLMDRIILPAGMSSTAPGISMVDYFSLISHKKDIRSNFERTFSRVAKPYRLDGNGNIVETKYLDEFGAFGGLATCVGDLLKYSIAIDQNKFVRAETQKMIFTPNKTKNGNITPYGFGWFTQNYKGIDFYWHYGQTQGESALFIKVPSIKMTFVALANSDMLSSPFPLGDGDLFTSPLGQLFYKFFIVNDNKFDAVDYDQPMQSIENILMKSDASYRYFYNRELVTHAVMNKINGNSAKAIELFQLYGKINFSTPPASTGARVIAGLKNISINQDTAVSFSIDTATKIRIVGVGENCSADFSSWCDYGWIEDISGKTVWQMQGQHTQHAGGAIKNQKVDTVIVLPGGIYKLRYKSDWAHAYNSWDSAPPDYFFWGIVLYHDENK